MNITLSNILPDPEDSRDYLFPVDRTATLPGDYDLRDHCNPIEDQLSIGSCTANAVVGACEMFNLTDYSRLFNYYTSRESINYLGHEGSTLRAALRMANKFGLPLETTWPYDLTLEEVKPSDAAYTEAITQTLGAYYRIPNPDTYQPTPNDMVFGIKQALAMGFPVAAAVMVGEKIRTLQPGEVYPNINRLVGNASIGGHAIVLVGYQESQDGNTNFIFRNSWGSDWGDKGYGLMKWTALAYDVIDLWIPMNFAGVETVGPNQTNVPPIQRCLSQAQVLNAYTELLGVVPADMNLPGPQYWMKTPGATVRDLYYAGKLRAEELLK